MEGRHNLDPQAFVSSTLSHSPREAQQVGSEGSNICVKVVFMFALATGKKPALSQARFPHQCCQGGLSIKRHVFSVSGPCGSRWPADVRQGGQLRIALVVRKAGVTGPT